MNREIKFRAWDPLEGKMWYPDACGNGHSLRHDGIAWCSDSNCDPVMQYAGLKDMNGREIYEGDLIRKITKDGYGNDLVREGYEVGFKWGGFELFRNGQIMGRLDDGARYEVLGNKYENPIQ